MQEPTTIPRALNIDTKWCNRCKRFVPRSQFHKRGRTSNGLKSTCKTCTSRISAEWRFSPAGRAYKDSRRKGRPIVEQPMDTTRKLCTACKQELLLSNFRPAKVGRHGVTAWCRKCIGTKAKEYSQRPQVRERRKELQRARRQNPETRERQNAYTREWCKKNWEKAKAANYRWRKANPEKWKAVHKRRYYKDVEATRARDRARRAQKWIDNPEQIKMWLRMANHRRKVRRYQAQGECSKTQFLAKCDYHGWRCIYCHIELTLATVTLEHRQPLSRQGSNWPANIAPACGFCNSSKHNKTEIEFRNILKQTLNYVAVLR